MVRCVTPLLGVIVWVTVSPLDSVVFSETVAFSPEEDVTDVSSVPVTPTTPPTTVEKPVVVVVAVVVKDSVTKDTVWAVIEVLVREVI
jgi:hypothetical protein